MSNGEAIHERLAVAGQRVAFALGGLGGMNAHGVGFLAAAREVALKTKHEGTEPRHILPNLEFISCSSGMIHWTAQYLRGTDLREKLHHEIETVKEHARLPRTAYFDAWRSPVLTTFVGLPGVFRPLTESYGLHLLERSVSFWNPWSEWFLASPTNWDELWDLLLPTRLFIPAREEEFYNEIANVLRNETRIGVAFNTFNLSEGIEYLHVNERGLELIRERFDERARYGRRQGDTEYRPIDGEYVQAGLWLLEYGFDRKFKGEHLTDGAYRRQIILDELAFADRIYVPRPVNRKWIGRLPRNIFEREDLKIEMWFNASYQRQSRLMQQISQWVSPESDTSHRLMRADEPQETDYHPIDIVELEIQTQRGYFHYFMEDIDVFDRAYQASLESLRDKELEEQG
ncbi:MAG: hypothetical protein M3198_06275 [Actinomycetota bacterium]|nr:hypothetical protein [Actinomycetota bacterium]